MKHPSQTVYYVIFSLLLVLLAATVVVSEIDLGKWNFVVATLIASIKATLIVMYFMHVRYSTPLIWLTAGAGFLWLGIMLGGTLNDYYTRPVVPPFTPEIESQDVLRRP